MRKLITISLIFSLFNISVKARETEGEGNPRLTFGLEWGYVAAIHSGFHFYYFAPEGFRVDEFGNAFEYISNAEVYVKAGYNLSDVWNIALYAGYAGVADMHKVIPVSLRGTRFFGDDPSADRWFAFMDIGTGICIKKPIQEILSAKAGGGYRLSLSRNTKLDFLFSIRTMLTHPYVYYDGVEIPYDKINRNNAYVNSLSVGIGLSF